jgi:hypothetical protein
MYIEILHPGRLTGHGNPERRAYRHLLQRSGI